MKPLAVRKLPELNEDAISAALDVRAADVQDELMWELAARICDDHRRGLGYCLVCQQYWPCSAYMLGVEGLQGSMRYGGWRLKLHNWRRRKFWPSHRWRGKS